jgi:hypothetical protein
VNSEYSTDGIVVCGERPIEASNFDLRFRRQLIHYWCEQIKYGLLSFRTQDL